MHVLIIEDNPDIASVIHDTLDDEGHTATIADSGPSALELLNTAKPEAVILDLMLGPEMDGFAVGRFIRKTPALKGLPLIVISAYRMIEAAGVELDTPYLLTKPFDLADLISTVGLIAQEASNAC